jgi:pseudaminic acid biosynthesis-associated methylase
MRRELHAKRTRPHCGLRQLGGATDTIVIVDSDPISHWRGQFGDSYANRNAIDSATIQEAENVFSRILGGIEQPHRVLEVGANVGINLTALRTILPAARLSAVEPNRAACDQLRAIGIDDVFESDSYRIPAPDASFDLVFTSGVLIHIPPSRLAEAMSEIVRVSRRYVLACEYFSHTPEEANYRGSSGMLWKRDFGAEYQRLFPSLRVVGYGFLWIREFPHFDNQNWWLFEK